MTSQSFMVLYRTGGTHRFEWATTLFTSEQTGRKWLADVKRMGYKAYLLPVNQCRRIIRRMKRSLR